MNLSLFQRPSRYIGGEINAVRKDAHVRVALAFPDIYDVGMSHLGLKILYKIINDIPYAAAERVFHPWLDVADAMKSKNIQLASLDTGRALGSFDIVGFSFQYELSYTSVLSMLSLGRIPLRSEQRCAGNPLIIAGGPCTVNPLPMAPFIDAFLIGDGEEAVCEIIEGFYLWKKEDGRDRKTLLKALSGIEGMYVPSIGQSKVKRTTIRSLDSAPYPTSPVVPYTQVVHDRINIEVSRGCTMGCRFCQAGMIYRPLRERSPMRILEIAEESIRNTGYDEVSLTSLSAGDYSFLLPLVRKFNERFSRQKVSVSLPSLRVKALNQDMLREVGSVRKTGFTIAPEAATERLRHVINKDFSEAEYEGAVDALFREGWHNLKLYYMIGLPTERGEDIEAIPKMVLKALRAAKKHTRRFVNINVGISAFVPKPHTPFQWCPQEDMAEIKRKKKYLKGLLLKKGMNIKDHNDEMSLLEAALSRGDEKLSDLIEAAYGLGARLDGWTESFDMTLWQKAMELTGIDAFSYARRLFGKDEPLPWDMADTGIDKNFLKTEFENALHESITDDCRKACAGCGLSCIEGKEKGMADMPYASAHPRPDMTARPASPVRIRVEFEKKGLLRHLSHRELITHITRALRRAGMPLEFSKGFHPAPRLSFGPPLGVGIAGLREYFDMELSGPYDLEHLKDKTNEALSDGIRINAVRALALKRESLQGFITNYEYEIIYNSRQEELIKDFLGRGKVLVKRENGNTVDIRAMVEDINMGGGKAKVLLKDTGGDKVRLEEVLREIFLTDPHELDVTRISLFGTNGSGERVLPF